MRPLPRQPGTRALGQAAAVIRRDDRGRRTLNRDAAYTVAAARDRRRAT